VLDVIFILPLSYLIALWIWVLTPLMLTIPRHIIYLFNRVLLSISNVTKRRSVSDDETGSRRCSSNQRQPLGSHSRRHKRDENRTSRDEERHRSSNGIQTRSGRRTKKRRQESYRDWYWSNKRSSRITSDYVKGDDNMSNNKASQNDKLVWVIGVPSILAFVGFACLIIWRGLNNPELLDRLEEYGILLGFISGPALMFMNSILELWKTEQKNEVDAIPAETEARLARAKAQHEHEMNLAKAQHDHEMKVELEKLKLETK